ncbi:MAG: hypothetical protein LC102_01750 [Ignavibacteriales bacterium]|nr:MAG: hypothetical protein F9K26_04500 [Ignavibacteriaceae bacterium]MBW7873447.1 hypothetical protein [Ignavibacteria bacterium]MCZ2142137.1 hypothetical protein [Ignavibacteriales bacterium]OQY76970.1 MAG: hypothetical protein B6D45_03225 [Ignavibacteriales bacterium UTCHB3]MBV6444874.1 hypothetical protein [Ignavibacteriaceae bacterium]
MEWYVDLVTRYPIYTAMVQFAVLGTLGDMIASWVIKKKVFLPFSPVELLLKFAEWAFLAVLIKYAFVGYKGFVEVLVETGLLPELNSFSRAFAISFTMNLQFGLLLVLLHRLLDNLIAKKQNWANINKGFWSLIWFWLPAHTVTFMLPKEFQIGLAAVWSVVLGLILGFFNKKSQE